MTTKGDGGPAGRKVALGDCFDIGAKENITGAPVPVPHLERPLGKDLVSQLIYACVAHMCGQSAGLKNQRFVGSIPTAGTTPSFNLRGSNGDKSVK